MEMKPAICTICRRPRILDGVVDQGDWVKFADYVPVDPAASGHPAGLDYFCSLHLAKARIRAPVSSQDAIEQLKKKFAGEPQFVAPQSATQSWLQKLALRIFRSPT
jgi:hypothetical protein